MTHLLIDTSVYSMVKHEMPQVIKQVRAAEQILVPTIVLGELRYGFELSNRIDKNLSELADFLGRSGVDVVTITEKTTEFYATIYAYLRRNGRPIPTNDIWIAACAMENGVKLLTADQHFTFLPQILTIHIDRKKDGE